MPAARDMALLPTTDTAIPVRYSRPLRRSAVAPSRYLDLLRLLNSLISRPAIPPNLSVNNCYRNMKFTAVNAVGICGTSLVIPVSAEVPGEEPQRAVQFEGRDLPVLAGVGVQRLLG